MPRVWIFLYFVTYSVFAVRVDTEKGETRDALVAHPLSWWTKDPLRFDPAGDLMLGSKAPDGKPLTTKDYKIEQKTKSVGIIAGHGIVQIVTSIHPRLRVISAHYATDNGSAAEWKDLLVATGNSNRFVEIYALHYDFGLLQKTSAEIYGRGRDAVLVSFDPDTGNGGGCIDGYWWFDKQGPHEVDFSPLIKTVSQAIPANAMFTSSCWALHSRKSELESGVWRKDAECRACGGLGEVRASYRIKRGVAEPVSVRFKPTQP